MKPLATRCKCLHCKRFFVPDYRNRGRQKYCSTAECQSESKRRSQQRWLSQPENRDYFRGVENVKRVQQWRQEHPGYWKRQARRSRRTLQETCSAQVPVQQELLPAEAQQVSRPALQELCEVKTPLLVGLIAQDGYAPYSSLSTHCGRQPLSATAACGRLSKVHTHIGLFCE